VRITIDGRTVGYDDTGGSGIPVVLLHGFGADRSVWDAIVPAFGDRRVIRLDFSGAGESASGDGPALMEALAGDVAALLDALHVERAVLAGHSLGGYVTFAFFRMYAERVAGLAFVASHARSDSPEMAAAREALAQTTERLGTMEAIITAYADRLAGPQRPGAENRTRDEVLAMMARQDPRGSVQLLRGMKERLDCSDLFADIGVPTLVIAGSQDAAVPFEASRQISDSVAGARLVVLEGVGHSTMVEAPGPCGAALAEFAMQIER
jgi:pimeloyl-ACP methyl ester carboxylesterase